MGTHRRKRAKHSNINVEGSEGSGMEVSSDNIEVENLYLSDDEGLEGDGERDQRQGQNTEDDGGNDQ